MTVDAPHASTRIRSTKDYQTSTSDILAALPGRPKLSFEDGLRWIQAESVRLHFISLALTGSIQGRLAYRCYRPGSAMSTRKHHYWYLTAAPELLAEASRRLEWTVKPTAADPS
jgi:hypothetical protein